MICRFERLVTVFTVFLLSLAAVSGGVAVAEEAGAGKYQLEQVVITAEKIEQDKQAAATSVTVVEGGTMEDMGVDRMDELTELSPNVHFNKIDTHYTQLNYRGIGGLANMNKVWNIGVDGVTVPYVGADTMFDVERVEVLKGSQGALYGRNTHAGMVNVITRGPTADFSMDTSLSVESFNTRKASWAAGGPLGEKCGYRMAFAYGSTDGYMKNGFLGNDDGARDEQFSGRWKFRYAPSPDSVWTVSLVADRYEGGFDVFTPLSRGVTTETINDEPGKAEGYLLSPTLTWERDFEGHRLTGITNFSYSNYYNFLDQDFTSMDLMLFGYDEDYRTWSQEFRLENKDPSGRLKWLAGMFLMYEKIDMTTDFSFGGDAALAGAVPGYYMGADSGIDSRGASLFGKVTWLPVEKLELSAGLRVEVERREMHWRGLSGIKGFMAMPDEFLDLSDTWTALLPSASVAWIFDDTQRVYASVARGYHVGDYAANQVQKSVVSEVVDPEYTMTYEVGYKGLLADKRFELNGALFYIDWTDMQVSVVDETTTTAYYQNAARAHSYGFELESRWRVLENLHLYGAFGWLKGEFDEYDNHESGKDMSGNSVPNANEYNLSVGSVYRCGNGFFGSVNFALLGPKYMDEENDIRQKSYALLGAKIGFERDRWAVYVYGRNLLDEKYLVHTVGDTAGRAGEPLVIGSQAMLRF
jgi:iron complex outermembrane receptor protein